ncbi:MAG: metallophosphoesterase family protein, partial [Chloroflexi bacterium]|nr:metallophosphoesterase family protein [Chloroflexota bacterium]
MKIAVLSDIHANLPALQAVLEHARRQEVEDRWNLGDSVGYGPFPDEVVQLIRKQNILSISGNYDRKVLKVKHKIKQWKEEKAPEKWLSFQWAFDHLTQENRRFLKYLPEQRLIHLAGWKILLVHASPDSPKEHLGPDTPLERLQELAQIAQADMVLCGHSHQPFARQAGHTWFINPGSVGRPDDGDPRAAYTILDLRKHSLDITPVRIDYNIREAVAAIREK